MVLCGEKKDERQTPATHDQEQGSYWDHAILDVESRLIVRIVVGRRTAKTLQQAFTDFYEPTDGAFPTLITTDEYAACCGSWSDHLWRCRKEDLEMTEAEKERYDWDAMPPIYFPVEIAYATVHKEREQGRVVRVEQRIICGTAEQVAEALAAGTTAASINTSYIERWNGTQEARVRARELTSANSATKAWETLTAVGR